jgi:cell division protein FtsW
VRHSPLVRESSPPHADRQFIIYLMMLVVFGLISLSSATVATGFGEHQDSFYFVTRQILFGLVPGIVLFLITARLDYHIFKKAGWLVYCVALVLLMAVFIPHVGLNLQGSRSWINLGFTTFQPAELAKIALIIIGSYLLADSKRDWRDWQSQLLPVLAVIGLPVALVLLQGDLGTGTIMIVIVAFLLVMGKIPTRYLMTIGLIGLVLVTILIAVKETRRQRIEVFWNPDNHTQDDIGSQIYQSKIAVGSGGFWGLGYGKSRQKFSYLPEVNSDSVFPIIGEELGFVGAVFLITLVILICWRGLRIGTRAPDQFGQFLVAGIIVWIGWQTFLNIGGIIGALPLTGVPLPLVSHGGSAYMMTLAGLGIVVSVSRQSKLP